MGSLRFFGDKEKAISLTGEGKRQMYLLKERMKFNDLKQLSHSFTLPGGDIIFVQSIFGQELIQISGVSEVIPVEAIALEKIFKIKVTREDGVLITEADLTSTGIIGITIIIYTEGMVQAALGYTNYNGNNGKLSFDDSSGYWSVSWKDGFTPVAGEKYWPFVEISDYSADAVKTQYPRKYVDSFFYQEADLINIGSYEMSIPYVEKDPFSADSERTATDVNRGRTLYSSVPYNVRYFYEGDIMGRYERRSPLSGFVLYNPPISEGALTTDSEVVDTIENKVQEVGNTTSVPGVTTDFGEGNTSGDGAISFTFAGKLMTWTPNGGSVGTAVNVSAGGYFVLADSTGTQKIWIYVDASSLPSGDAQDTDISISDGNDKYQASSQEFAGLITGRRHFINIEYTGEETWENPPGDIQDFESLWYPAIGGPGGDPLTQVLQLSFKLIQE